MVEWQKAHYKRKQFSKYLQKSTKVFKANIKSRMTKVPVLMELSSFSEFPKYLFEYLYFGPLKVS